MWRNKGLTAVWCLCGLLSSNETELSHRWRERAWQTRRICFVTSNVVITPAGGWLQRFVRRMTSPRAAFAKLWTGAECEQKACADPAYVGFNVEEGAKPLRTHVRMIALMSYEKEPETTPCEEKETCDDKAAPQPRRRVAIAPRERTCHHNERTNSSEHVKNRAECVHVHTSNEKEISHGRVSWQTHRTYFPMGPLASS